MTPRAKNTLQAVDSSEILGAGAVQATYTLLRKGAPGSGAGPAQHLPEELRVQLAR